MIIPSKPEPKIITGLLGAATRAKDVAVKVPMPPAAAEIPIRLVVDCPLITDSTSLRVARSMDSLTTSACWVAIK